MSRRRWTRHSAGLLLAVVTVAGCGTATSAQPAGPTLRTASVTSLGSILVDAHGHALYVFVPDHHHAVTCTQLCAGTWPPLTLSTGQRALPSGAVQADLIGADSDPGGGRVVTYHDWPLYTYTGDVSRGTATGQGLDLNGGLWFVISASGAVVHARYQP